MVWPVVKAQGIPKGGTVEKIGGLIRVVAVERERLRALVDDAAYGARECRREGFPDLTAEEFVTMFCEMNGCDDATIVTRIVFEYLREEE